MTKRLLTSLLLLPAVFATTSAVQAQCPVGQDCPNAAAAPAAAPVAAYGWQGYTMQPGPKHPHFPPFGCGGYCIGFLSRIHFHGPLYNYGPYTGYYPFEPYGPWTSDLRYNGPRGGDGSCGWWKNFGGNGLGWGHYSLSTLKNVFHRVNPLAHKCGSSLDLGKCCSHGSTCTAGTCGGSTGYAVPTEVTAQPAPTATTVIASPTATGILTSQPK